MANRNRSAEKEAYWRWHVEIQAVGSLSIRGYCRKHRLAEPSFHSWRRELRKRDAEDDLLGDSQPLNPAAESAGSNRARSKLAGNRQAPLSESGRANRPRKICSLQPSVSPGLVALDIIEASSPTVQIELPGRVVIRVREEASVDVLQRVIAACQHNSLVASEIMAAHREVQSC